MDSIFRLQDGVSKFLGLLQGRGVPAEAAAQVVAAGQQLKILAVSRDAAHTGDGAALRRVHADDKAAGDGKYLGLKTVGGEQPPDRFLHPVDLRAAGHELAAQLGTQIQQTFVIHRIPPSPTG